MNARRPSPTPIDDEPPSLLDRVDAAHAASRELLRQSRELKEKRARSRAGNRAITTKGRR